MEQNQNCAKCHILKEQTEYTGKNNKQLKTCISCRNNKDGYYIVATIKGKQERLDKVEEPTFMNGALSFMQKKMLRAYVLSEFEDIMDNREDLTRVVFKKGRKILFNFDYSKN